MCDIRSHCLEDLGAVSRQGVLLSTCALSFLVNLTSFSVSLSVYFISTPIYSMYKSQCPTRTENLFVDEHLFFFCLGYLSDFKLNFFFLKKLYLHRNWIRWGSFSIHFSLQEQASYSLRWKMNWLTIIIITSSSTSSRFHNWLVTYTTKFEGLFHIYMCDKEVSRYLEVFEIRAMTCLCTNACNARNSKHCHGDGRGFIFYAGSSSVCLKFDRNSNAKTREMSMFVLWFRWPRVLYVPFPFPQNLTFAFPFKLN